MLQRLKQDELLRWASWAYGLATVREHAGCPTWLDGVKTREDFLERARRAPTDEETLVFRHDGEAQGWIR